MPCPTASSPAAHAGLLATLVDGDHLLSAVLGVGVDDVLSTLSYVRSRVSPTARSPVPSVAYAVTRRVGTSGSSPSWVPLSASRSRARPSGPAATTVPLAPACRL